MQFSKFNNVVSWRDFAYVIGNSCRIKKKVTKKEAMKKTFWKHSIAHLSNKNKALNNLCFPLSYI